MRYLSLFDGIGAASVAWEPLGWECVGVSEIDRFPIAVTSHHRPSVPHLGDVTKITESQVSALGHIDLIVGGFPCQDLSVAGKRAGLRNEDGSTTRSGLFFDAMRIVQWARKHCGLRYLLIENVPGLYSSNKGRDFAAVVGAMVGTEFDVPGDGWRNAGFAVGPEGMCEWATLDAQFFNVAQRRVRVFALADFGDWSGRPPILLEPDSMRGDSAPSREAGERVAPVLAGCSNGGGANGPGRDVDPVESLQVISMAHGQGGAEIGFDRGPTLTCNHEAPIVAHTLRGEGFDASEDGTGRGTPLVPVVAGTMKACKESGGWSNSVDHAAAGYMVPVAVPLQEVGKRTGVSTTDPRAGIGIGVDGDPMFTLQAGAQHGVAIAAPVPIQNATRGKDQNGLGIGHAGDPMYTLDQGSKHAIAFASDDYKDGGGQVAVAFDTYNQTATGDVSQTSCSRGDTPGGNAHLVPAVAFESRFVRNGRGAPSDVVPPLKAQSGETGKGDAAPLLATAMQVRRLTPVECSRLQGFPDDYLLQVPWRGKATPPDGPMYKALGNSMAVPVMRWIGSQIERASAWRA